MAVFVLGKNKRPLMPCSEKRARLLLERGRARVHRFGFPRGYLTRQKQIHGFQTGDRVKAVVAQGKKIGTYVGRVAVRASGSFNLQTAQSLIQGISYRYCTLIQRGDGYGYSLRTDSN